MLIYLYNKKTNNKNKNKNKDERASKNSKNILIWI